MKKTSFKSKSPSPSGHVTRKIRRQDPGNQTRRLPSPSRQTADSADPKSQITSHRRAQRAQREGARQMQALVASLDDVIIEMDERGAFLNVWTGNESMLVKPKAEMLGRRAADLLGEELSHKLLESSKRVLTSGQYEDLEYPLVVQGGRRWFSARMSRVVAEDAAARSVCLVVRDITERRKTEQELIAANSELVFQSEEKEKRAAELIIANKELTKQNAEKEKRAAELTRVSLETARRLEHIQALHTIDMAISESFDLRTTLKVILDQTVPGLEVDAAALLLLDPYSQSLHYAAGLGFRTREVEGRRLPLGEGRSGLAALERRTLITPVLKASDLGPGPLMAKEGFVSHCAAPLITKGRVEGVLEIFHRSRLSPEKEWLEFLETLAGQAAMALESVQLFDALQRSNIELSRAYDATIDGWSHALDLRHKETEGHTQRVTEITVRLARGMGIGDAELVHIRRGALLHDIGKIGVSDSILLKPGPLTDDGWNQMHAHPRVAYDLLSRIAYLKPALDIPYCHHEKWDGTGYPRGLKGEQIPFAARIFSVVDVWDALNSDRPYRLAWTAPKAREYIDAESGKHFDPRVVQAFSNMLAAEGIG